MNDLEKYFKENEKRVIHKWKHYFDIYERHFRRFKNKEVVVLEIGVSHGGSLQMWKNYFGDKAKIYGMDINPECKEVEETNINVFIGSQTNRKFLNEVRNQIPPIDILIDDGGHTMAQQIIAFEELFDAVKNNGVYLCEDMHTSYRLRYGGGYKRSGTFVEYSKNFIDYLNAHHSQQKSLKINKFTESVDSIHFYDSVLVVEKRKRESPYSEMTGNISINHPIPDEGILETIEDKILVYINEALRFFRIRNFRFK